jgi:RNA polymerase II subunit A small phosphatase-like protein
MGHTRFDNLGPELLDFGFQISDFAVPASPELIQQNTVYPCMTSPTLPLLILDLDETLIHGREVRLARAPEFEVGPYAVYERPRLRQFLQQVAAAYRLAVWSAGSADYMAAIVERIAPPESEWAFVWARERCTARYHPERMERYWVKDLKKVKRLGYDLGRVLMVDDTPSKLERNFGNAVYVRSFEGDLGDDELPRLATYLLSLADWAKSPGADFRRVEKRGWRSRMGTS